MKATDHQDQMILSWKEVQLQNHIIQMATALGWDYFHVHDSRRSPAGFPDLVLVHPRKRICLVRELKTERGRFRPKQEQWLQDLRVAGIDAGVWRPGDVVSQRVQRELSAGTEYGTGSMGVRP